MNQSPSVSRTHPRPRIRRIAVAYQAIVLTLVAWPAPASALTRQKLDFVVGVNGDFKAGMAAAKAAGGKRFLMFFPNGEYNIGALTGDANQMTTFPTANVSFIGQSVDSTVICNKSINEGIGITATLYFNNADNLYMQDLTVFNKAVYGNTAAYNTTGRHVAIQEQSDKVVYKNVKLKSTQDTYYTKGTRTYWEGGEIHGTTDFICGSGDVFFRKVKLWEMKSSAITAASSTNNTWGYVFKDCTIDGTVTSYTMGRSWNDAKTVFLNTTMNKLPTAAGWGDPMNSVPKVFAEYKSTTSAGAAVDLGGRRKSYALDATIVTLNPVLTDAEAAKYTVAAVLGGTDNWQPDVLVQQLAAPVVAQSGTTLKWDDNANALCWVLFKNGVYLANTTTNSYDAASLAKGDRITVRAANSMGGLGTASAVLTIGSSTRVESFQHAGLRHQYRAADRVLSIAGPSTGRLEVSLHALDGSLVLSRHADLAPDAEALEIPVGRVRSGTYILRYAQGRESWQGAIEVW